MEKNQKEQILEMLEENINVRKNFITSNFEVWQKQDAAKEWLLLESLVEDIKNNIK